MSPKSNLEKLIEACGDNSISKQRLELIKEVFAKVQSEKERLESDIEILKKEIELLEQLVSKQETE